MLIDTDHLVNQIHAKVEGVAETGFPMDVFPERIQRIIYDLVTYENFNLEYTASIILSAYATAIGNTYHVKIKGNWVSSCALFMILVGRPGLGKTPPLGFLYQPIRENDRQLLAKAHKEYELYEQQQTVKKDGEAKEPMEKPRLVQTVISDFTPEAMLSIHYDNPRGIVLLVDEVVALFNSVKRYSAKSNLIEDLLSAYSGQPIKAVRKTEAFPMNITRPCINLIGGVQTNILDEIFRKEYVANGLTDRFLFVFPKNKKIPEWQLGIDQKQHPDTMNTWSWYVNKVLNIPFQLCEDGVTANPKVLEMTKDAKNYFYCWNNEIIDRVNAIEDDNEVESRQMKLNGNAARLALILQVIRWSAGECQMDAIDLISVKGAISLIDYFEESYQRVKACTITEPNSKSSDDWLEFVGDTFTSADAEAAAMSIGLSRRTVYSSLKRLCESFHPPVIRVKQGVYSKIVHDFTSAQCTSALSDSDSSEPSSEKEVQSAEVQSASGAQEGGSDE